MSFESVRGFAGSGLLLHSTSTLRLPQRAIVEASLRKAGFALEERYVDWDDTPDVVLVRRLSSWPGPSADRRRSVRRMCEHAFVRWSGQLIEQDEQGRLPGRIGEGVVRTFDAPEALDTRFYEVRAKSALNRVPRASRMPFEWTVNPYRGCTHACTYCADGATPVLMADGRTKPLGALVVGDRILGTELRGGRRRYVETEVLDHWSTIKPAFRTTFEDGTALITSGDHRLLTVRGWRRVAGAGHGGARRLHLARHDELLGTGRFDRPPDDSPDYRRGYLCGLIRGDERLVSLEGLRPDGTRWTDRGLRLALADLEALRRARTFMGSAGMSAGELVVDGTTGYRPTRRAHELTPVAAAGDLRAWPIDPSDEWRKGFLAGIFDAAGASDGVALRIVGADRAVAGWTIACLAGLGFDAIEERAGPDRRRVIRLQGAMRERLRFFQLTDPAVTRKRTLSGAAVESGAATRVVSVEPLRRATRLYDVTTGTGDYIAGGVVSHNCFARPTHEYLDLGAGRDFEREIVVKVNVPEVLRAELTRPSWRRQHVALGTNTDPYQWVEGRYELMRGIWEALRDAANPCSILTKSPLLLRDVDLLQEIAARTEVSACLSVPTLDEKAWRASEPRTPNPRARLTAVAALNRAGIPTGILIAPLMPGINDAPEQVEEIIALATEAGAVSIGGITLHLRGSVRGVFFDWLRGYRPDLVPRYERLYARGAYVKEAERRRIERAAGLPTRPLEADRQRFGRRDGMRQSVDRRSAMPEPSPPQQTRLF